MHRLAYLILFVGTLAAAQPAPPAPPAPAATDPAPAEPPAEPAAPEPPPETSMVPAPAPAPAPEPPPPTAAEQEAMAPYEASSVSIGGYLQPQVRMRQNSPAQFDQDGFRFARARLILTGETHAGNLDLSAYVEAELQPTFGMVDAYATVVRALPHHGKLTLDLGQMRVPISRQNLLSDSRLSFVDKAQLATIAPDRDLGARLTFALPHAPVKLIGGVFNGEARNQVENINEYFLYAGRLEVSPFGRDVALAESSFGGKYLTFAGSVGRNTLTPGDFREVVSYLGADVSGAWKGVSGSFEYLRARHTFEGNHPAMLSQDFTAQGFTAQLAYLLPFKLPPIRQGRLEIAGRIEEIDRNDTIPIAQLGDPNQSVRAFTGVLSFYLRMHSLKAQLAATHFTELEDKTATGADAAYANDQLLLQVTYRLE